MKIQFYVTQKRIDAGILKDCRKCPVARAINARLKSSLMAKAAFGILMICKRYPQPFTVELANMPLPRKVKDFIWNFDYDNGLAKPFRFTMDIPKKYLA